MIPGLYSAATAMDVTDRRHEMVAENLANLQMPGYRRRIVSQSNFDTLLRPLRQSTDGVDSSKLLGATADPARYDFSQGNIQDTKRQLDVALNGDGFFTVQGSSGPLYTRSGAFHLDPQGTLVTQDGLSVLGQGGSIQVPGGVTESQVEIAADGSVFAGDQQIGQLALTRFADNSVLTAVGASLFAAGSNAVPTATSAEVLQGRLEMANTSSVTELINLISISRHRDAAQKALNAIADTIQKRIGLR
ncbi:MAG TPA: flagellar hook basal-body protein [Planctomycetaceae bacterium]|nr:flagellar hook basal-body protein [Planctomycetaceae bacterium]